MAGRLIGTAGMLLVLTAGCVEQGVPPGTAIDPSPSRFDEGRTGTVHGVVAWDGAVPEIPAFTVWHLTGSGEKGRFEHPNPNVPRIDPKTRAVGSAVVFLRGVDATASRPWDHPPPRVEIGAAGITVDQGERSPYGFVRRGAAVEMVSTEKETHALRMSGATFFTLPFPDPDQPLSRTLSRPGVAEVTSGLGHFWYRAYLFVDDHPYWCRTDREGRFRLPHAPEGRYEIVCWMPNWHEASHERDPETSRVTRLKFRPPVEKVQTVEVKAQGTAEVRFDLSAEDFGR